MNKKLCFNSLIAAALLLTGLGANAASEVESLCLKTKIQGNYKSRSTDESHDYLIMQDGCRLGIIEHQYIQYDHPQNKTITWNFSNVARVCSSAAWAKGN